MKHLVSFFAIVLYVPTNYKTFQRTFWGGQSSQVVELEGEAFRSTINQLFASSQTVRARLRAGKYRWNTGKFVGQFEIETRNMSANRFWFYDVEKKLCFCTKVKACTVSMVLKARTSLWCTMVQWLRRSPMKRCKRKQGKPWDFLQTHQNFGCKRELQPICSPVFHRTCKQSQVILYTGRLLSHKGVDLLLEAHGNTKHNATCFNLVLVV